MSVVAAIDAGPQFQRALAGWQLCTRRAGVDVTTISGFFGYADSESVHGKNSHYSVRLGQIYASCLAPAEAVRDQLRHQARASFETAHSAAIDELSARLAPLVARSSH